MGFYQDKGKRYKRYRANISHGKNIGEVPNFIQLVKEYSGKNLKVLDIGCGSGELTLQLTSNFKEIVGIDFISEYISTAKKDKIKKRAKNIEFINGDAKDLPFENNTFDLVYSSRGLLSADFDFIKESIRVLKKGGFLIEETIGENDKLEIKKIFQRGQNYPPKEKKIESVKKLLILGKASLIFSKEYIYYTPYKINKLVELLQRAPIIEAFDIKEDSRFIKEIEKRLSTPKGIILSSHRLHWVAKKL